MEEHDIPVALTSTADDAREDESEDRPVGRLSVYSTQTETFVIGSCRKSSSETHADSQEDVYRVLRLAHSAPHATRHLNASEYPISYDNQQVNRLIQQIHIGNHSSGGLTFITNAITILGVIRFVSHYYLLLVTKKALVGVIRAKKVYRVADIALIPLSYHRGSNAPQGLSPHEAQLLANAEKRYRKILLGLDLTRCFFFSLSYNLTASLQVNMGAQPCTCSEWDSPFTWNAFISLPLRESIARSMADGNTSSTLASTPRCRWTVPVTHGSFEQRKLSLLGGRFLTLTLISRRSRYFAGTRYKKRGINDKGQVANEVETEQILDAGTTGSHPLVSSFVQVRGSIPLSWSQQTSPLSPKPDVILYHFDPTYKFTGLHFKDLINRYCPLTPRTLDDAKEVRMGPIICLNLIKSKEKRPRETVLRAEYAVACQVYNEMVDVQDDRVIYVPWDFSKHAKMAHASGSNVLVEMEPITRLSLDATGIFVSHVPPSSTYRQQRMQSGVLRTCCIDCLDRTNVAQFALGLAGLGRQLMALGLSPDSSVDADSSISLILMNMYEAMGNEIALQYGGSAAHSVIFDRKKGEWEAAAQGKDILTSLKRFYNNSYTDAEKQDAINLFLGNFVPGQSREYDIWDLEHDLYLHTGLDPRASPLAPQGHPSRPLGISGTGQARPPPFLLHG